MLVCSYLFCPLNNFCRRYGQAASASVQVYVDIVLVAVQHVELLARLERSIAHDVYVVCYLRLLRHAVYLLKAHKIVAHSLCMAFLFLLP